MKKSRAIELLGGTVSSAAKAIGTSYQAVHKWPDVLPPKISDRVEAAYHRTRGVILPELNVTSCTENKANQ